MAHLPQSGRWQLVDPRITAGLLGGAKPPFGILEVDFSRRRGTARWWTEQALLSNVVIDPSAHDRFSAGYALRGNSGAFRARLRDDGVLEMDFYQGPPILKCRAVPRASSQWNVRSMAILTCVGNPGWPTGPGHSALIADHCVYTFEVPNISVSTSGWKVLTTPSYLSLPENLARPIIIQELDPTKVRFNSVMEYIERSTREDEDFVTSGWCSMQSAAALSAGVTGRFNPRGLRKPQAVYNQANAQRLVTSTYLIWDRTNTPAKYRGALDQELAKYYPGVGAPTGRDVRDWAGCAH